MDLTKLEKDDLKILMKSCINVLINDVDEIEYAGLKVNKKLRMVF
jgi:hypothetical protein